MRISLILGVILYSVIPGLGGETFMGNKVDGDHAPMIFFFLMYGIGAYIRLHLSQRIASTREELHQKSVRWSAVFLLLSLIAIVLYDVVMLLRGKEIIMMYAWSKANIFAPFLATSIFLFFVTRKSFSNQWINRLALSVLGIYLIHGTSDSQDFLWSVVYPNLSFLDVEWYPAFMLGKTMIVFLACIIIDQIRLTLIEPIYKRGINMVCDKLEPTVKRKLDTFGRLL